MRLVNCIIVCSGLTAAWAGTVLGAERGPPAGFVALFNQRDWDSLRALLAEPDLSDSALHAEALTLLRESAALEEAQLQSRESMVELFGYLMTAIGLRLRDPAWTADHLQLTGGLLVQALALRNLQVRAADGASDHDLHGQGVLLANLRDGRGKLLHKALDKRHRLAIGRFEKSKTTDAVRALWRHAVKQGDIPGGYWAALTHPATNDALIREIFGEVHMLSHLVGAANRADIRRLSELEAENACLRDKLARQQDHLRDGITSRDARIRELSALLASRIADQAEQSADDASDDAALGALIASLEQRLRSETNRRAVVDDLHLRAGVTDDARARRGIDAARAGGTVAGLRL